MGRVPLGVVAGVRAVEQGGVVGVAGRLQRCPARVAGLVLALEGFEPVGGGAPVGVGEGVRHLVLRSGGVCCLWGVRACGVWLIVEIS